MDEHEEGSGSGAGSPEALGADPGHAEGWDRAGAALPAVPDPGYWSRIDRSRWAIIGGTGVVAAALLVAAGLAVWLVFGPKPGSDRRGTGSVIPSEEPSSSVPASAAVEPTLVAPAVEPTATPAYTRAPFVAFRRSGAVWVSGEHGASPVRTIASAEGVFSLSPDGRRVAVVDALSRRLMLVDVVTGRATDVGDAMSIRPEWSADSATLVYTRQVAGGAQAVWRVAAEGSGARRVLADAWYGRFVPGTGSIAALASSSSAKGDRVAVLSDGRTVTSKAQVNAEELVPLPDGVCFVDSGMPDAAGTLTGPSIQFVRYDGSGQRIVVGALTTQLGAAFGSLSCSPDGQWLAYAEIGDDGYSRMFAVPRAGGAPVALSPRHEDSPVGWSADGAEILFFEGNAAMGETTRLMAVHPDGSDRRLIADDAGL